MNLSGGHSGGLSPDAVRTGIDAVVFERYSRDQQPGYVGSSDPFFFKQGATVGVSFISDEDSNVGEFESIGEQEEFLSTDTFIGNQITRNSQKYYKQVPISDEAFRADMVGKRDKIGQQIGDRARQTQDRVGIQNTYGDAFAGAVFSTPDGDALASASHTTLKGATVDNLETGSLTPDNLWTGVNTLATQAAQDGDAGSHTFDGIFTNFLLYKTAKEIMNSTKEANSAENNLNIFETDYGQVNIGASIFLDSAYNSATNAATSYHLLSVDHEIARKVFYGLTLDWKTPNVTSNDTYAHVAKFHEVTYPMTWTGYVGSNGTT